MTKQTSAAFTWNTGSATGSGTTNPIVTNSDGSSGPYAATVFGTMIVGGGVTAAPSVQVQESPDGGTTWYSPPGKLWSPPLAAATYGMEIPIDPTTTAVRLVYAQQTTGTSTFTAQIAQITGV